jgi:TP901 family phage tail tape measure protein
MAKAFNLTAQLNIQGPNNLKPVIGKIKSAISSIKTDIKLNIDTSSAKNISAITRQLNALAKASDKANSSVSSLSGTLANLASGFNNAAGSVASSVGALNQVQKSVKSSGTAIVQTTSAIEDFGKASGLAVRRFAAFSTVTGVIYGLTNAITAGYKEFLVFNKEVVRLSQVTGQSVKDLKGVTDEITRLATNFGVASSDLLAVSSTLAQAGLSASDTRIALEALAKSALAPSFDNITDTTEGAIAAMRQFGIQAGELESALGSINSVAAAFAVESSDIITAIQRTGGVFAASSKGVSEGTDALNEFIAVFTSIRATTRESAETIATGLRTIFTRIQRGKTIEALKEYGVVLTDLQGKFVGPYEATRRLSEGLSKLDPRDLRFGQIVEELGGFRQIGKVIPLIQQFATAEQALGIAQKGQTSLSKDASIAQQALAVQFTKTRESFLALIRDIGDSTSFKVFTTLALTLANAFISLAGALKPLLPLLLTVAGLKIGSTLTQFGTGFLSGISGGKKKGFASGGLVPGSGSGDTVPAMLTPGEFVIRKKAVETIGADKLHKMNKYAKGGIARATVSRVVDGDTLNVDITPTTDQFNTSATRLFGYDAYELNSGSPQERLKGLKAKQLAESYYPTGKDVTGLFTRKYLQKVKRDKYGRYFYSDTMFGNQLIKQGLGITYEGFGPRATKGKNLGGIIQKFLVGGSVKDIATTKGQNVEDTILGFVKELGGIDGVKGYLSIAKGDRELNGLFRKGGIGKNLSRAISLIDQARQAAEDEGVLKANAMAAAQQLAIVGFDPVGYSDNIFEKLSNTDSTINVRGILADYAEEAQGILNSVSGAVNTGARRLQSKAIFGGSKNLVFDFDDTLVSGADIYKPGTNEIDIPGYSDLNKVAASLAKGQLTELGEALKSILASNPDILDQMRIVTARPPSNSPLLANRLQELGLNIPASKITGVSGSRNKPAAIGKNEKLIDDLYATVAAVRKGGGEAFPYSPLKNLTAQEEYVSNLAAAQGSVLQAVLGVLGARGGSIQNEDVDFKTGLGPQAASFFGVDPNIPTEVKRTLSSDTIYKAKQEFTKWFASNGMASGGSVQDTVPAMLTPGEFVINKQSAQAIGYAQLNRLNKADKIAGFNKGGGVGSIQYFGGGSSGNGVKVGEGTDVIAELIVKGIQNSLKKGIKVDPELVKSFIPDANATQANNQEGSNSILEDISTVQITTAITSVLLPQISTLADSFGKINNSYLKGFGEALQSSASSALSTTTAFKLLSKDFSQTNKAKFLTGGIAAGSAIGAGLTGFSNQSTTNLLEKNSKVFSQFNKALEDSKNAIDEESKAKAAKELDRAFRNLSRTVQENTDALSRNELIGAVGDSASRLSSNITTISTAFLALRPVLNSVARQGLRTGAGFAARAIGAGATLATGGTAALVIGAGLALYEAYNIGTAAIKYFTESSKIAGEETAKFGQALLQVTQQQLKNRLNEPTTIETVGRIRDIRANTDFSEEKKQFAVASGVGTNILLQQRLRADLGLAANKDIEQYLNEIKGNTQAVNDYNAKLEAAQRGLSKSAAERFIAANPQSYEALKGLTNLTEDELRNIGLKQMGKEILDMSRSAEIALYHIKPLRVEMLKLAEVSAMLSASVTRLTANAERSSTELQNSVDITLGKAKFTTNTNLQKTLDVLSNPKGNTTEAFKAALQDALGSLRVSSKDVTPGVESVINNLEGQLTALQFIEKNAASTLSTFNDIPELAARSDQDLQKVFEDMIPSGGSITDEVRKNIAADMAKRVQSFQGQGTAATVDEIFGTAREDIITANRENLKVLTDVQKARIDAEKRFIDQMNQNLELMNQSTQNLQKQQGLQAEVNLRMQKMFGAGEPSLNQLNAPFNTRLKVLTGGITDPAEIGRQRQAAQENFTRLMSTRIDPNRFTGGEFTARQKALDDARNNEANKINNFTNALEMLTNNTESLSNAFDKLSQKQEELFKTGENALDIFTSALDPVEFQRKVEAPFNALNRLRAGVGTRSQQLRDIATVRGGMGTLAVTEQQTQSINNLLLKTLEKISGVQLAQYSQTGMQRNPEIQKLQADVQTEVDKTNTAAEILRKAMINAGGLIVTGAEDIRANFNKGLASSLLGIVDDINNIRIKVFGQATETRLPVAENGNITAQRQSLMDQILEQARSLGVTIDPETGTNVMTSRVINRNPTLFERTQNIVRDFGFANSLTTIMGENNQQILELIRQLEQLKAEGKVIPVTPRESLLRLQTPMTPPPLRYQTPTTPPPRTSGQVGGARDYSSSELQKSISDLTLSVADLKSTIDSKQSIVDGVAVANFNTAVNKLNETTIKVAHNFDVNQDIRMDVAGDVTLSPETIAAISSDIRNQTNNAIAINIRNLETFGSRRSVS